MNSGLYAKIYGAVKAIPKGKVATYGQIAALVGRPRAARLVGNALHANPTPIAIPCHRVVNRYGRLAPAFAFGGDEVQKSLLESEGVTAEKRADGDGENYYVDLSVYQWRPQLKQAVFA